MEAHLLWDRFRDGIQAASGWAEIGEKVGGTLGARLRSFKVLAKSLTEVEAGQAESRSSPFKRPLFALDPTLAL